MTQGDTLTNDISHPGEKMNAVFRVYRYPVNYAAFIGKVLTPGNFIELYPSSIDENDLLPKFQNYPNPFTNKINLKSVTGDENFELTNAVGQVFWSGTHIEKQDFSALSKGVYLLKVNCKNSVSVIKLIKQ